ncbi:uncharacterized protein LOC134826321 [Bolinopsis microptera]|uniref:uncharacterized protein LOC134826321 n=1 Tax=Bolinopsis microptera TaxID=2820187 RepID=UPI003079D7AA
MSSIKYSGLLSRSIFVVTTILWLWSIPVIGMQDCNEKKTTTYGSGQLNITENEENELISVIKCQVKGFQFVNGVRRTTGLNVFAMDQGLGITVTCNEETGALHPNIFEDLNGDERVLYCDEGCTPYREDRYEVVYPASIVTSEENSPPLISNNFMSVSLACQPGYTRSVGNVGKISVLCKKDSDTRAVAWSTDNIIDCISGCKDITQAVSNGATTDKPSTTKGASPFRPGDSVTFFCDPGYTLVGYKNLTCTGANIWNENTPECVYIAAV